MRVLRNFPALAGSRLPRSAIVLDVQPRPEPGQAPALVCSVDDADNETVERRFAVLKAADPIPAEATFVKSWRESNPWGKPGTIACLFELVAEEIPAAIPPELHRHYRHLTREGFTHDGRYWQAPDDHGPLAQDDIIALTELTPYGYGGLANA